MSMTDPEGTTTVPPTTIPGSEAFGTGTPFTPVPVNDDKRYSTAIGVEGRRVTNVATGETTYEGYRAPSATQKIASNIQTPYVPNLPERTVEPRYFVEDLDGLSGFSRPTIASWQMRLNASGLLGNNFSLGVVDNQTRSAYGEVLAVANREGVTAETALNLIQQQAVKLKSGSGVTRYKMSNPADIKAVINQSAQALLGRTLDDGQLDAMVRAFQQQEVAAQRAYQAGGTVTDAPSAQQFAATRIEKDFGDEVDTRRLDAVFGAINQALMGGK
jgi:hypothetical protein